MCVCIQTAKSFLRCQTWLPRFWGYRQRFGLSSRGWGCWLPWQWYSCPSFVDTVETVFNARGRILFCTVGATEVTFTSLPTIQSPYQTCKLSGKGHLESSWPGKTWLATGGVQNVAVFFASSMLVPCRWWCSHVPVWSSTSRVRDHPGQKLLPSKRKLLTW